LGNAATGPRRSAFSLMAFNKMMFNQLMKRQRIQPELQVNPMLVPEVMLKQLMRRLQQWLILRLLKLKVEPKRCQAHKTRYSLTTHCLKLACN